MTVNAFSFYACAHCGGFAKAPYVGLLDGGTTLACDKCGEYTIVDLSTPEERVKQLEAKLVAEATHCSQGWNAVAEALSHLYECYNKQAQSEEVLEARDALMHVYDTWLG